MSVKSVLKAFERSSSFLIATHVNPDPDAVGSQLALFFYLKSLHKKVYAVSDEPSPARFAFIPGIRSIKSVGRVRGVRAETAVLVDCGEFDRIGKVAGLIPKGTSVINIDHHVTNDLFGTHNLVVPSASSTAEIVFDLLAEAGAPLDKRIATLLYLGLMTDTGSFRYENTSAHTHEVAARLVGHGISAPKLYKRLYESVPATDMAHFTKILSSFEFLFGGRAILVELPRELVTKFSEAIDLRDQIFKFLRSIKGVEIVAILTEQDKRTTRVNFRSQGRADVAKLAALFGGGGHSKASGCVIACGMPQARRKVLKEIGKRLRSSPSR